MATNITPPAAPVEGAGAPAKGTAEIEAAEPEAEEGSSEAVRPEGKTEGKPTSEVIAGEPYNFDGCQVQVSFLFLPRPADGSPRQVVCGVRTHLDDPILTILDAEAILAALPDPVKGMLEEIKAQFPVKAMEWLAKKEKPVAKKKVPAARPVPAPLPSIPAQPAAQMKQPDLFGMFK